MTKFLFASILCLFGLASVTIAGAAEVTGLRLGQNGNVTRFVIDVDRTVAAKVFTLSDPYRLVIDLPDVDWKLSSNELDRKGRGIVKGYRYGKFRTGISRLVLDLKPPPKLERFFDLPPQGTTPHRIVLDLAPTSRAAFIAERGKTVGDWKNPAVPERAVPVSPSVRNRRLVVIDPGHGGIDPGTTGVRGTQEKTVVLEISKALAVELKKRKGIDVRLTRTGDIFLPHRERFGIARDRQADLFISVHADWIRNRKVRGGTVYTLSERASDKEAAALAAKENRSDIIAGLDLDEEPQEVGSILIDLARRETMNYSARFANILVGDLSRQVAMNTPGHRSASLLVLKAPDIPSVLLETGYLSNRQDERLLSSGAGQRKIAQGVADAIQRYFGVLSQEES